MKDSVLRQKLEVERTVDTGDYQEFRGLRFKIIDRLPPGEYLEFTTDEPTFIKQSTGAIKVTAKAPTIIEGGTGKITIDGYAPMIVRGSTGGMDAHLRDNSAIEGTANYVNIKAAPHLELIADSVRDFNGKDNQWELVHLNAPEGNRGVILFKGGASSLNFEYDNQAGLYLPKDTTPKSLVQRARELLK
ncbi:MAG TPA: hypothetical protein VJI98_05330 [Candidatus Nanoarchaeia archaeon]|nr:hypothetical protein [Candidatus Nanoarchaeia archaeon]